MKTTKKSLLVSSLTLVLCLAMLLGTTWAWFTDSIESGTNQIIAGNLDVELYHYENGEQQSVDENTRLFDDVTLWEPGAYAYETFTIKNVGNLALKYSMQLNKENVTVVDGHSLDEVLKVAVVDEAPTGRVSYENAVALNEFVLEEEDVLFAENAIPENGSNEKTFTLVVYWEPGENDNLYNMNNANSGNTLSIDLGVKLVATQHTYENDSFGNDYDANAQYPSETVVDLTNTSWNMSSSVRPDSLTPFPTATTDVVNDATYGTGYRFWINFEYKIGNTSSPNTPSITFYPETETMVFGSGYWKPYKNGSWTCNVEIFNITPDTTQPGRDVDKNNPDLINWFQENFGAAEYQDPNAVEVDPLAP